MALTVQRLLSDPIFRSLPASEQLKGLREVDSIFASPPSREQLMAIKRPSAGSVKSSVEPKEVIQKEAFLSVPQMIDPVKKYLHTGKLKTSLSTKSLLVHIVGRHIEGAGGVPQKRLSFPEFKAGAAEDIGHLAEDLKRPHGDFLIPEVRSAGMDVLRELKYRLNEEEYRLETMAHATSDHIKIQHRRALTGLRRDARGIVDTMYPMRSRASQDAVYVHLMEPPKSGVSVTHIPGATLPPVPAVRVP